MASSLWSVGYHEVLQINTATTEICNGGMHSRRQNRRAVFYEVF